MTSFEILSKDRLVQSSTFGENLTVVANFSNDNFKYKEDTIKAKSLIIYDGNNKIVYKP